jgi:hypothetical protein
MNPSRAGKESMMSVWHLGAAVPFCVTCIEGKITPALVRMDNRWKWILLGAAGLAALCTVLPWYARNGVSVSGFGGPEIGNPAWVALTCAVLIGGLPFAPRRWRDLILPWPIVVLIFLAAGNLWRAYKQGAVGFGLPLLLLAGIAAAFAAYQLSRTAKS